jgi:hypothetical protein
MLRKDWPSVAYVEQEARLWHIIDRRPQGEGVVFSALTREAVIHELHDRQYELDPASGDWICRAPPPPPPVRPKPVKRRRPPPAPWERDRPII